MPERVWDRFLNRAGPRASRHGRAPPPWIWQEASAAPSTSIAGSLGTSRNRCWRRSRPGPAVVGWRRGRRYHRSKPLLKAARETRIPIVHMTGLDQSGMEGWTAWREPARPGELSPEALDRRKRRWDIIDEVAPPPGEAVLRKSSPQRVLGDPAGRAPELSGSRHHHHLW